MSESTLLNDDDFLLDDDLFADEAPVARSKPSRGMAFFNQLPVQVSLELASAEMSLGELTRLGQGDVITLDRMVGEPLDIRVNGALLGRGEVVEVNGRYGVRLLEVEAGGIAAMQD
ncbi:flagellar motor switch protein FliN [Shewanella sp. GXUN23E]|uniref:flagellar motor switch protein FliN n=1 Tax=Shewanella sp. GXUN23E TaxID=3422498 RepID=UPI003D7DB4B0